MVVVFFCVWNNLIEKYIYFIWRADHRPLVQTKTHLKKNKTKKLRIETMLESVCTFNPISKNFHHTMKLNLVEKRLKRRKHTE